MLIYGSHDSSYLEYSTKLSNLISCYLSESWVQCLFWTPFKIKLHLSILTLYFQLKVSRGSNHCGIMKPDGDTHLNQHCFQVMTCCLMASSHYLNFPPAESCGIHMVTISQEIAKTADMRNRHFLAAFDTKWRVCNGHAAVWLHIIKRSQWARM